MLFILANVFLWIFVFVAVLLTALLQYNLPRFNLVWLFSVLVLVGFVYSISHLDFSLLLYFFIMYAILCGVSLMSLKVRSKLKEVEEK
ncbi:hypothetical protein EBO34_00900 [Alteribacter keqinensis]|uniref:Uncharacterized protein n=1 Tax=Alteribacter keqinensis TaxID=2483800 RepID=A0A3M7TUA3_9BACI|nr:hypothetical protein EBO34_00900 [Alteribacter keqinensis]